MPRRLAVSLWGFVLAAAAIPAIAMPVHAASCTGWKSEMLPPATIRVFRTQGPAIGTVQTVNFRTYVQVTFGHEWPGYWPAETLKAGAVAVKQYGWYRTMHWRGKSDRAGHCYDVVDYWADQVYQPEKYSPTTQHLRAVVATWAITLRKTAFIAPGYWAGEAVPCGSNADGLRMYQWSAYDCGRRGYAMEWILRRYYPSVRVVDPGQHDIVGAYFGDGGALSAGTTASSSTRPIAYASTGGAFTRIPTPELAISPRSIIGRASADVTGDGREDLVLLTADGTNAQSLRVVPGTATGYGPIARWWLSRDALSNQSLRLVTGDYNADGRMDAGLLAKSPGGYATFFVLRSLGNAFAVRERWWYGYLNIAYVYAFGGDFSGDGRADLVVEIDAGTKGLWYRMMASRPAGGPLNAVRSMLLAGELRRATTRTVRTDFNRDGRDDLVVAVPYGAGTRLRGLVSSGTTLARDDLWTSTTMPWRAVKPAGGDLNGDGFGDLVLYDSLGANGTRVRALRSTGSDLVSSFQLDDALLDWSTAIPY
jgi:stage II sporulation SpoD-like protein/VCBS repeat protein